jgi:hypothetical protein
MVLEHEISVQLSMATECESVLPAGECRHDTGDVARRFPKHCPAHGWPGRTTLRYHFKSPTCRYTAPRV